MPKPKPEEIDKEIKRQEEELGEPDETELGIDVEEDLARVIGNEPSSDEEGFSIAEEVEQDSQDTVNTPLDPEEEEELE